MRAVVELPLHRIFLPLSPLHSSHEPAVAGEAESAINIEVAVKPNVFIADCLREFLFIIIIPLHQDGIRQAETLPTL